MAASQSTEILVKVQSSFRRRGANATYYTAKKLSKTKLIEAMVRAFSQTNLDVRGVKMEEELLKRVIAQLR